MTALGRCAFVEVVALASGGAYAHSSASCGMGSGCCVVFSRVALFVAFDVVINTTLGVVAAIVGAGGLSQRFV